MPEKWLYLPIEVIARELDAKLLLTYFALKHNYHVILAKQHKLYEIMESLPKGIFVSKGYPRNKKGPLFNAKKLGHAVVDLDEEGLIFNEKAYLHNRINENYFNILDQIHCWGNGQRDALVKAYGNPEKLYLTGHPRFDLVKKKFRSLYNVEVEGIKREFGDFILVNTRFGKYNHLKGFNPRHEFIMKLYNHFIKMVKELSEKYPNLNIVVRPHPREVFSSYEMEFENEKNVFVVSEGNVVKWNLASKLVIHNGCTTGIEAFLLDQPVISYMPITSDQHTDEYLANAVSYQASNIYELTSFIDSHLSGEINRNKEKQLICQRKKILSNYYSAMDENYAYENIIRLLDNLNVYSDSTLKLEVSTSSDEGVTNNQATFTQTQIEIFLKSIDKIEGIDSKMNVQRIDRNFFVITPTL
jgi:surface carbohydrate biosynthesis protein